MTAVPAGRKKAKAPRSDKTRAERRLGLMLCAPAVVAMLLVTAYPIGYALVLSVQDIDLRFPEEGGFVGLDNYISVLSSDLWWQGVFNTSFIAVVSVIIELILGMILALIMHRAIFGRGLVRTAVLIPYGIVTVVAAFAWFFAFDPASGFVNNLPLIDDDKAWFGERFSSFAVIIMAEVWKTTPFMALLLLAGLATIDEGLYEAAKVDGANAVQRFFKITLPLLRPALLVALLFRTLDAFRVFDSIFVMTRGSQNTESISILGYNQLISRLNLGLGSAVSVLIFVLVLLIAFVFVRGFGTSAPTGQGEKLDAPRHARVHDVDDRPVRGRRLRDDPRAVDRLAVAEDAGDHRRRQVHPRGLHVRELRGPVRGRPGQPAAAPADQLGGDRADRHGHRRDARLVHRLRDRAPGFPGQVADPRRRAGHRHVPADLRRRPAVRHVARRWASTTPIRA